MKKRLTIVLLLALSLCSQAQVKDAFSGILPVTDRTQTQSLNGTWQLKVIEGISDKADVPQADATWGTIPVPGCWEAYGFCKPSYDHAAALTGYYRTAFTLPETLCGQRVAIRFDGVLYGYDLFLNGRFVGSWRSGYNTAVFDLTPYLDRKASRQQLAMRVISQFRGSDFDYNDDWAPTGIFRDVTLMAYPDIHLSDLTIRTRLTGEVSVDVQIAHADSKTHVEHDILDAQGHLVGHDRVEKPHLWTAETPYLYTLRTRLLHKGKLLQTFTHRFGFRQLTVEGNILKLNGTAIKLRGVTSHATDPRTVKVVSDSLTLRDMQLMKEASVNYIRTSHYPREPRFYELADSLGFYVIDEVPFGFGDKNLHDSTFYAQLQQRAQATVRRDKNHPSVLIWSLGNENPLTDICIRLGDYVKRELDASRPVCYPQVGSYFRRFNYDFPKVADIYAPHYPTTGQLADFYQRADRPVVFTEYCHTLGISFEDHDRQWEIIERTPCIAGGSVWEWVDQGMPFKTGGTAAPFRRYGYEERVFTSSDGGFEMFGNKGTDGLLYADRTPLPNYYELQHNYARAAVTDSIFRGTLHIRNRYDFLNLKDNVTIAWTLTADRDTVAKGAFSPDCRPHTTVAYPLQLPASLYTAGRLCLLQLSFSDAQGHTFLRQTLPVEGTSAQPLAQRILGALPPSSLSPDHFFAESPRIRAGRKATMAERLKVGDRRLEPYLLRMPAMGADIQTETVGTATHYTCTLSPDTTDTFLSELGIAFLLDQRIDRVQWIGQGPLPSYPGRRQANRYGFWAKQQGDLYFEGNRMGVDAALLTDREGNGLLIVMNQGNVNFEQTDRGIVVSVNAAVAGQGPKFARTAFPVTAREVGTVSTDFYVYSVNAADMPSILRTLFAQPQTVPAPFSPFLTQYDTYLMRFEDIAD
ncbi:MAG: hypothetical protein II612_02935 [Prevotella sp.]|nr:hypothetical protein [Prevotella sp.]